MTITLSKRIQSIKPSPTLALAAKAKELQAQGKDIIDLTVGEPDFPTPQHIKNAAIAAINGNFTKYTAVDGIPKLKQAIVNKLKNENALSYEAKQILVSVGAKHSLYNLIQTIINPNDEVIIPAPYWVSYPDMVLLADGKPVIIPTTIQQNFKITPQQLTQAITPATRAIIINSPSNPSGMAYSKKELQALATILQQHPHIAVISDDIYEHILWNHLPFTNILNACPELSQQTIIINGVSKSYAMTGWRIGYAAGPTHIINAMKNIQSQSTSNPTSIAQIAAETALREDQSFIHNMQNEFKKRHDYFITALNQIDGFSAASADGAFYAFPQITSAMRRLNYQTDTEFSEFLLNKAGIATVPGSAFGTPGYLRFSYATSLEKLQKAIENLSTIFKNKLHI